MNLMSRFFALLLLTLSFVVNTAIAEEFTENGLQKFYIPCENIRVANNGIFVLIESHMLNVSSVFVDDCGVYIVGLGVCRYCNKPNDDLGKCQNAHCPNYGKG